MAGEVLFERQEAATLELEHVYRHDEALGAPALLGCTSHALEVRERVAIAEWLEPRNAVLETGQSRSHRCSRIAHQCGIRRKAHGRARSRPSRSVGMATVGNALTTDSFPE